MPLPTAANVVHSEAVPDFLVALTEYADGFLLDGYPKDGECFDFILPLLEALGLAIGGAIFFDGTDRCESICGPFAPPALSAPTAAPRPAAPLRFSCDCGRQERGVLASVRRQSRERRCTAV